MEKKSPRKRRNIKTVNYFVMLMHLAKGDNIDIVDDPDKMNVVGMIPYDSKLIYPIIREYNGYGLLRSKAGWINLSKTVKHNSPNLTNGR